MWEITIHYLHLHSLPLHNAVKSTIHSTSVHLRDTVVVIPGEAQAGGYESDIYEMSFSCFFLFFSLPYQPHHTHMSPGG